MCSAGVNADCRNRVQTKGSKCSSHIPRQKGLVAASVLHPPVKGTGVAVIFCVLCSLCGPPDYVPFVIGVLSPEVLCAHLRGAGDE